MDKEKMSSGLILLVVGIVILLNNLGYIDFYWRSVINMWPVILIIIGVNLLVPRRGAGNAISIVVTLAALAFLAYKGTVPSSGNWWSFSKRGRTESTESRRADRRDRTRVSEERFAFDYNPNIVEAHLRIKGGAIEYEIDGTTDKLFEAETKSSVGVHTVNLIESLDSKPPAASISFVMEGNEGQGVTLGQQENTAKMRLNPNPVWNIQLDFGAGVADFDLSDFKVGKLRIKGGASAVEVKLGAPLESSQVNVTGGVSSVEIEIPESAACRVVSQSGLSSRNFRGFTKQPDGSFTTEGYDTAATKYDIQLNGGLSSFEVKRY